MWRQEVDKPIRGISLNIKQIDTKQMCYFILKNGELYINWIGLRSFPRAGKLQISGDLTMCLRKPGLRGNDRMGQM